MCRVIPKKWFGWHLMLGIRMAHLHRVCSDHIIIMMAYRVLTRRAVHDQPCTEYLGCRRREIRASDVTVIEQAAYPPATEAGARLAGEAAWRVMFQVPVGAVTALADWTLWSGRARITNVMRYGIGGPILRDDADSQRTRHRFHGACGFEFTGL
jgi:hypothetical protein